VTSSDDLPDDGFDLADEHVLGDPQAPVTVVEYGDFECPYCAAAAPVLRQLVDESDGRVRLIFRNFPLPDVHPHALTAALAAEAAGAQGAYWPMHHVLFTKQDRLDDRSLRAYAEHLGLDGGLVVGEAAQRFGDKVEADFSAGLDEGVAGTPTLLVDGEPYAGRIELAALRRVVNASANGVPGSGGTGAGAGVDPGPRRQRRWTFGSRRAQREALAEEPEQQDPGDGGGH
jgi:protein-disulfide isomerase